MIGVALGMFFGACLMAALGFALVASLIGLWWARRRGKENVGRLCGVATLGLMGALLFIGGLGSLIAWHVFDLGSIRLVAPTASELQGTYRLTPESARWLKSQKGYDSIPDSVVILDRENIKCLSIPDCVLNGFGEGSGRFWSGEGTWTIEHMEMNYRLVLDMTIDSRRSFMPLFCVMPNDDLRITIGDPDSDEYISYRKAATKP